jgi:hypothetical protein
MNKLPHDIGMYILEYLISFDSIKFDSIKFDSIEFFKDDVKKMLYKNQHIIWSFFALIGPDDYDYIQAIKYTSFNYTLLKTNNPWPYYPWSYSNFKYNVLILSKVRRLKYRCGIFERTKIAFDEYGNYYSETPVIISLFHKGYSNSNDDSDDNESDDNESDYSTNSDDYNDFDNYCEFHNLKDYRNFDDYYNRYINSIETSKYTFEYECILCKKWKSTDNHSSVSACTVCDVTCCNDCYYTGTRRVSHDCPRYNDGFG